ncbi:hypothetical protein V1274_002261 [Bradyrhizobium sp. AZCC 1614]|uniref:hypothetical protein n=1 Tax=unclassified Bradyrhizobium TaxID=2631580 RepID=UPI002FF2222F
MMGFAALYPYYGFEYDFATSRHHLPEVCSENFPPSSNQGRREDRVLAAPEVSCAVAHKGNAHEHTGTAETLRPSLRNGFTAYFVLFPENGFLASVAPEKLRFSMNLTPAPRRPNHTTSPYASCAYVYRAFSVHRISPHVRDDRERPSMGETGGVMRLIWVRTKADYF